MISNWSYFFNTVGFHSDALFGKTLARTLSIQFILMILGGIQKNSLIDYPGKVSCVLFLAGCNFNCPYCHNPELAKGCMECPRMLEENNVYEFLEKRKGLLDAVVISGGEPTLQKDLISLCERIKNMGYPVKLDTNGSRPRVIKGLIDRQLVDYVAMDIKTDPFRYSPLIKKDCNSTNILSSICVIMESGLPYEFKTTCVKPLVNEQVVESICHIIQGARLYALQLFHDTHVLCPEFFGKVPPYTRNGLMRLKTVADPWVQKCLVR